MKTLAIILCLAIWHECWARQAGSSWAQEPHISACWAGSLARSLRPTRCRHMVQLVVHQTAWRSPTMPVDTLLSGQIRRTTSSCTAYGEPGRDRLACCHTCASPRTVTHHRITDLCSRHTITRIAHARGSRQAGSLGLGQSPRHAMGAGIMTLVLRPCRRRQQSRTETNSEKLLAEAGACTDASG